jgi:hypothetical protein
MTPSRLLAIGCIYASTALAWFTLGASVVGRSGESDARLAAEVAQLWGGRHRQLPPEVAVERERLVEREVQEKDAAGKVVTRVVKETMLERGPVALESTRVDVELHLDQRRKGLLWYDTYEVSFRGAYRLSNPDAVPRTLVVGYSFPSAEALYDAFEFRVNGQETPRVDDLSKGIAARVALLPRAEATILVSYRSRGLGDWVYAFGPPGIAQVRDFRLAMTTDFRAIDFPPGTISPSVKAPAGPGWALEWRFESLVTGQGIGMDLPDRQNPGPLVARMTFFAPVSLLFFMTVLVMLGLLHGRSLHPVHYFFLAAAFFSFHLLLAYLVDHMETGAAFAIAAATSVLLVVSYLRIVGGVRFAFGQAGLAQVVFLVLFSYAFFFEGATGLTVTVGAVVTLFVLMQLTARVDWDEAFLQRTSEGRRR